MSRCAPVLRVWSARVRAALEQDEQTARQWREQWDGAADDTARHRLVAQRIASAVARRDERVDSLMRRCQAALHDQRAAVQSAVVRVVRDAADQAAVAPYVGGSPAQVAQARDRTIAGLIHQWTALVLGGVQETNAAIQRIVDADPWSSAATLPDVVHALGLTWSGSLPVNPPTVQVSVTQVLCEHGPVALHTQPSEPGPDAVRALTAWAQDVASRTPQQVPVIGWDHIRDSWGQM